jgi:4-hydroxybenzoate polyprenyltransferase
VTGHSPSPESAPVPDHVVGHWVERRAPASARPFLRLARIERPIGWWLLLLPCWWSAALTAIASERPGPDPVQLILFLLGAVAMRGAGSTYNDIVDRKLDARVERTRLRPLPSGQVSVRVAALFLTLQSLVGLAVLLQFNWLTVAMGVGSLGIVALYPFAKRVTWMPQLVLGFAFAWGGLVGWTAARGSIEPPAVLLYLGAIAWVVGYDTIYAVQDLEDDAIAGIKSSARLFGPARVGLGVGVAYGLALGCVVLALVAAGAGLAAYAGAVAFGLHLAWQVRRLDPDDGAGALNLFRSNRNAGLILFAGLVLDALWRNSA